MPKSVVGSTMATVKGIEGLSMDEIRDELARGAKFVVFSYCISALIMTFRLSSDTHFLRKGEVAFTKGCSFALVSLFFGWWGFPWGLVYTPIALFQTLTGGKDVTQEVMGALEYANPPEGAPLAVPPIIDDSRSRNPWSPS